MLTLRPVLVEQFFPKNFDEIKKVKKALKQCKDEWLEQKKGKNGQMVSYIGHNTVKQILDHAVDGITYWDFGIIDQWREEVYAYNKQTGQWYFDGYVYHVKGYMFIPGIGYREQFGCKVAVGGVNNQDSAYKSAASNCFTKCASMFGVGEEIYSKIKVEMEAEEEDQQYQQLQKNPNYMIQSNQQQIWDQPPQYQQYHIWPEQIQQPAQQPIATNEQQELTQMYQTIQETDREMQQGNIQTPFDSQPNYQATQQNFYAQPQQAGMPNQYQPETKQYGAPVNVQPQTQSSSTNQQQQQQQQNQVTTNPWQEQGVIAELQRYQQHKARLNITDDSQMIGYLRDYFKDEKANINYLTPENIKGFNDYLETITA
ncbi:Rad52/Rad22 family DNA repair protein [Parageobacillus galactosidasius]|uniref:Rad52/Rad22 family DNA repair protein n=1 Tax=Parageobacillus galactosidasius TaxID=883812 RepID=UPI00113247B9|nr:Rad52/Rad22 family DNA repair protein [Parageobacillus galactosidasius]